MRQFRGQKVKGWVLVNSDEELVFIAELNQLMDKYDFIDTQFSINKYEYAALVLIAEKPRQTITSQEIKETTDETKEKLQELRDKIKKLSEENKSEVTFE